MFFFHCSCLCPKRSKLPVNMHFNYAVQLFFSSFLFCSVFVYCLAAGLMLVPSTVSITSHSFHLFLCPSMSYQIIIICIPKCSRQPPALQPVCEWPSPLQELQVEPWHLPDESGECSGMLDAQLILARELLRLAIVYMI